jgi:hypothetical protein
MSRMLLRRSACIKGETMALDLLVRCTITLKRYRNSSREQLPSRLPLPQTKGLDRMPGPIPRT